MTNTALQRVTQAELTNKSGGAVAQGDVVVVDLTTAASFTTNTTSAFVNGILGVVLEVGGIANNAVGLIAWGGPVPIINLSSSASLGDLFKAHSVAKQAVRHASPIAAGDFGIVLGTGTSPAALLWGLPAGATGAGSGDFSGPASAVSGNLVSFNGTGGKTGQDSAITGTSVTAILKVGHGCSLWHNANVANSVAAALPWNQEAEDTDAFHDTVTNNSRITIPSGFNGIYLVSFGLISDTAAGATGLAVGLRKNGTAIQTDTSLCDGTSNINHRATWRVHLADADYIEIYSATNSGGTVNLLSSQTGSYFQATLVGPGVA